MVTEPGQKRPTCGNCGADVRENTAFCYRCGKPVGGSIEPDPDPPTSTAAEAEPEMDDRTRSALDDLAVRLREEKKDEKQLAKAAEERRRKRIAQRKPKQPAWEPDEGSPSMPLLLVAGIMLATALLVVYFAVIAK